MFLIKMKVKREGVQNFKSSNAGIVIYFFVLELKIFVRQNDKFKMQVSLRNSISRSESICNVR